MKVLKILWRPGLVFKLTDPDPKGMSFREIYVG